ncbi:Cytochrome P450 family protein [Aspergillus niger]|uniref:Cytochrome P450 family protein n=1 Tax=Aspergillus niger TaxID=5061 RepID=A0A505IES1_ASPNG|nr:Cytochrome P450 family protein [Aspergillus niger]
MSLAARIVILAVFVLLARYVVRLMLDSVSHTRAIPGPLWSRLTNLWYLRQMVKGDFHNTNIKLHRQKGTIVRIAPNYYSLSDPACLKTIYGLGTKYVKSSWYDAWNTEEDLTWTNLFSERDPKKHAANRHKVASMYSMTTLTSYEPFVDSCIGLFRRQLDQAGSSDSAVNLAHWVQCYAFDVIGYITFGERFGFLDNMLDVSNIMKNLDAAISAATYIGLFIMLRPLIMKILRLMGLLGTDALADFAERNVKMGGSRKATYGAESIGSYSPMLNKLLEAKKAAPGKFTEWDIMANVISNVGAGSDTTAISLSAVFYFIYSNPETLQRLRDEINVAGIDGIPRFSDTQSLPYFQAVLKECLRLHPGTGFPMFREVPEGGAVISGQFFPPKAEKALMERSYMPFGMGSRTCIGKNISLEMNKLIPLVVRDIPEGGAAHHPVKTDGVDGMGVITLSDSATFSSYFGPSSNVALVYELTRVLKNLSGAPVNLVNPRAEGVEASHNQQSNVTTSPSLIPRAMTAAGAHNLPPEPEATSLLHEYFDTIGLFFPCIYRDTFLAKYRVFRRNDSSPASRSWQALLFVMFAVMYQMRSFASPTDAEDKLSWEFLQKALNLAMPEAVIDSDLETAALSPDLLSSMFDKFSSDMVLSCACCQGSQYKPDGTNATETLSLLKNSGFSTIKKCMYTCSGGVALAKTIVDEQFLPTSLWGAWWMTNFLVFNASMMHFEDIDLILSDLKDASEVHRRLNRNNLIISRCRECLHNFLDLYKSFRDTTSPKGIGAWEDLTLSLQQPEFENTHGSQTATSSILPNLEQNSVWFDMEAFPGPMA